MCVCVCVCACEFIRFNIDIAEINNIFKNTDTHLKHFETKIFLPQWLSCILMSVKLWVMGSILHWALVTNPNFKLALFKKGSKQWKKKRETSWSSYDCQIKILGRFHKPFLRKIQISNDSLSHQAQWFYSELMDPGLKCSRYEFRCVGSRTLRG